MNQLAHRINNVTFTCFDHASKSNQTLKTSWSNGVLVSDWSLVILWMVKLCVGQLEAAVAMPVSTSGVAGPLVWFKGLVALQWNLNVLWVHKWFSNLTKPGVGLVSVVQILLLKWDFLRLVFAAVHRCLFIKIYLYLFFNPNPQIQNVFLYSHDWLFLFSHSVFVKICNFTFSSFSHPTWPSSQLSCPTSYSSLKSHAIIQSLSII